MISNEQSKTVTVFVTFELNRYLIWLKEVQYWLLAKLEILKMQNKM